MKLTELIDMQQSLLDCLRFYREQEKSKSGKGEGGGIRVSIPECLCFVNTQRCLSISGPQVSLSVYPFSLGANLCANSNCFPQNKQTERASRR